MQFARELQRADGGGPAGGARQRPGGGTASAGRKGGRGDARRSCSASRRARSGFRWRSRCLPRRRSCASCSSARQSNRFSRRAASGAGRRPPATSIFWWLRAEPDEVIAGVHGAAAGASRCSARATRARRSSPSADVQIDLRVVAPDSIGRGAAVFHRVEGAQRQAARHGGAQGTEDQRVRRLFRRRGRATRATRVWAGAPRRRSTPAVGLPWIPPELREGAGEVELARKGRCRGWSTLGRPQGRPAPAHAADRRVEHDRRDGPRGGGARLCVHGDHRPSARRSALPVG